MECMAISEEWRNRSWKFGDRPKSMSQWIGDFALVPKHDSFFPIAGSRLIDEKYPNLDTDEFHLELVGEAMISGKDESVHE
jgi:hypothetical protein